MGLVLEKDSMELKVLEIIAFISSQRDRYHNHKKLDNYQP